MTKVRKWPLLSLAALITLAGVTAGVFFWQNTTHPAPAEITYPRKVCGGALSGSAISPLFPEKGKKFEDSKSTFAQSGVDDCMMAAGGRQVDLRLYSHLPNSSAAERMAHSHTWDDAPGYTKISLGAAVGYAGNRFARLDFDCKSLLRGPSVLSIWINYYDMKDNDVPPGKRESFAALAADALRFSAGKHGLQCEQAAELPEGPPALGWPHR
ncbi:hypothetical protein [Streptomyces lydicus]|uniref:hypothetical protein n=1 Tax=Streptomyces lydicus TaxID=47763 RepID=UPI0037BB351F